VIRGGCLVVGDLIDSLPNKNGGDYPAMQAA